MAKRRRRFFRIRLAITVAIAAVLLAAATSADAVTRIPARCTEANAPRLCAIHFHYERTQQYRHELGLHRTSYEWQAERYPGRRGAILTYWAAAQDRSRIRLAAWRRIQSQTCAGAIQAVFPRSAWPAAFAIASRESGLRSDAVGPQTANGRAVGCFQLMPYWWNGSSAYGWRFDPYNAHQNALHAFLLWRADGGFCPGQWCL